MEKGHRFEVSAERQEKQTIDLAIPGLVVWHVIHCTSAASLPSEPNSRRHYSRLQIFKKH